MHTWEVASGQLLATCKLHANMNIGVALSPDGKTLAAWGSHFEFGAGPNGVNFMKQVDGSRSESTVQLFDAENGKELRRLPIKGERDGVGRVAFTPDSKLVAVAGRSGSLALLRLEDGKEIRRFDKSRTASDLPINAETAVMTFSSDGKTLAVARDGVEVWETATGERLSAQKGPTESIGSLVFVGDQLLACGVIGHALCVWDAITGKARGPADAPVGRIVSVAWTTDRQRILAADATGRLSTFEVPSARSVRSELLVAANRLRSRRMRSMDLFGAGAVLSPHGKYAAFTDEMSVCLRDMETSRDVAEPGLIAFPGEVCASFSCDGKRIVLAGRQFGVKVGVGGVARRLLQGLSGEDSSHVVELRDVQTGKVIRQFRPLKGSPQAVALSPDARLVAAVDVLDGGGAGKRAEVHVWDAETGKQLASITTSPSLLSIGPGEPLVFSPDGNLLALTDEPNFVYLYEAATGKRVCTLPGHGTSRPGLLAFSPDGRVLAVGSGRVYFMPFVPAQRSDSVELWELCSAAVREEFATHTGGVTAFAFSDDGRLLATGGADTTTLLWDIRGQVEHPVASGRLGAKEGDGLWRELSASNAQQAFRAILRLSSCAEDAVALFRKRLNPAAPALEATVLKRLARQLDSQRFAERETAAARLKDAGKAALPGLQEVLKQSPSTELRHRAEKLIEEISAPPLPGGGDVRSARALEVLENVNTPEARGLLRSLADGRPDAGLTREAKAVLERLSAAR